MSTDFDGLLDQRRDELIRTFAEKHTQMYELTQHFQQSLQDFRAKGWNTHAQLWNIGMYINITAHDLSVLTLQLAIERDPWPRNLLARQVALVMYEIVDDLRHLLGRPIRDALQTLQCLPTYEPLLRHIRAPLDRFWGTHARTLNQIRGWRPLIVIMMA